MLLALAGLSRRLNEAGLVLGGLGALVIIYGASQVIRGSRERERERWATVIGALLIGSAFALQLISILAAPGGGAATTPSAPPASVSPSPSASVSPSPSP